MMVYVVIGSVGEYSDRREWVVAALRGTEQQAQAWVDRASALSRALWKYRDEHSGEDWAWDKDDATMYDDEWRRNPCRGSAEPWGTELDPRCDPTHYEGPAGYRMEAVEITDLHDG